MKVERVASNLACVELVMMTSPKGIIKQMVLQRSVFVKSRLRRGFLGVSWSSDTTVELTRKIR